MTVEQIAETTGMSHGAVLERIESGELRAAWIAHRWQATADDVTRFWRNIVSDMVEATHEEIEGDLFGGTHAAAQAGT
jgi:hypothetical protein